MLGKVLIPQIISKEGVELLESYGFEIKMGSGALEENLIEDVEDCDAILLRTAPCTKAVLEAGNQLKIVARHGAGYNNVDIDAATKLGILVTNSPDSTTNTVAEFTLGAILAITKKTFLMNKEMKKGNFFFKTANKGIDLSGKKLGIVGFGRIGRRVAHKAFYGLDMEILAYSPSARKDNVPEYVTVCDWDTIFKEADIISLHMPHTKSNTGCVGAKEFSNMKSTAYFVNCARGEVVNEKELVTALEKEEIAGAFLDVFEMEPPSKENPLLSMDNVIFTPHMASNTEECMMLMATQAASEIIRVLTGKNPNWPVNKPVKK
ncbi:hydroxyacid dehydrogenase [Fusobacterium sp. PH5-44]|uniref:hydroxyacid dehydrogenase n=1 Tax=unclassified Fusobacterium TaxID=2648384 RepID=UPI003D2378B9